MKRIVTLIVTFLILTSSSVIQAQKFKVGLQTGLDISNIHVANKSDFTDEKRVYSPLALFNVDAYLGFKSNSFWGLSIEPGFIRRGGQRRDIVLQTGDILYAHQDVRYISNFIQLPLLVDFYITDNLFVSIGPEFDLFLSSKEESQDLSFDTSDAHDKLDFSGGASISYSISKNFDIRLLYNHSITSSSFVDWTDESGSLVGSSKQYYQYFQLALRFKISMR
jgi:hypothetical protein